MNKQEFNRLAAEFLGLKYYDVKLEEIPEDIINDVIDEWCKHAFFDPYDNANDMLLLEEKLKINTTSLEDGSWISHFPRTSGYGKTPHESRRACAEEYLKEWKK